MEKYIVTSITQIFIDISFKVYQTISITLLSDSTRVDNRVIKLECI